MTYPVAEVREIAAPAESAWALVADLPRMGELSPENVGGSWLNGATGPALGAVFTGTNKNGVRRWSTKATVIDCTPGRSFEIAISSGPMAIANWRYEFEATAEGCRVTESWNDHRTSWMRIVSRPVGDHSAANATKEMTATLANLAASVEK